jgi:hypothetical protein
MPCARAVCHPAASGLTTPPLLSPLLPPLQSPSAPLPSPPSPPSSWPRPSAGGEGAGRSRLGRALREWEWWGGGGGVHGYKRRTSQERCPRAAGPTFDTPFPPRAPLETPSDDLIATTKKAYEDYLKAQPGVVAGSINVAVTCTELVSRRPYWAPRASAGQCMQSPGGPAPGHARRAQLPCPPAPPPRLSLTAAGVASSPAVWQPSPSGSPPLPLNPHPPLPSRSPPLQARRRRFSFLRRLFGDDGVPGSVILKNTMTASSTENGVSPRRFEFEALRGCGRGDWGEPPDSNSELCGGGGGGRCRGGEGGGAVEAAPWRSVWQPAGLSLAHPPTPHSP